MARVRRTALEPPPSRRPGSGPTPQAPVRELPVWPEQVVGAKHVRAIERMIGRLREEGPHGNRALFLDDVFVAYLLAFFNPALRTLRTIEDFSQTRQARKFLSVRKICRSTLS